LRFAVRTMKACGLDEGEMVPLLREISKMMAQEEFATPAHLGTAIQRFIVEKTGILDPYLNEKREQNRLALSVYSKVLKIVEQSCDPLFYALLFSSAGNVIDLGVGRHFDLEGELHRVEEEGFAVCEYELFKERLASAKGFLLVADNAGEIVFDRILLEMIPVERKAILVKGGPIINDALRDDVVDAGITGVEVLDTGLPALGVMEEVLSGEVGEWFSEGYVVIAKGHANFETLDDLDREIFFLLKVKCDLVARELGVSKGDRVFTTCGGQ